MNFKWLDDLEKWADYEDPNFLGVTGHKWTLVEVLNDMEKRIQKLENDE
jgi:hypothetical protein